MKKFLIPAALCILSSGMLFAQEENSITLPDGTVLKNPYLLGRTPSTITVGHNDGGMRVAIKDLPQEYQKALHYDPAKAAQYEKTQAQAAADLVKAERKQEIHALKKQIRELKTRIASDEANLDKMGSVFTAAQSGATQLAAVQSAPRHRYAGCWGRLGRWGVRRYRIRCGGTRGARRAERERIRQIRRLNEGADAVAQQYIALDQRIQQEKIELGEKEEKLAQLEEKLR